MSQFSSANLGTRPTKSGVANKNDGHDWVTQKAKQQKVNTQYRVNHPRLQMGRLNSIYIYIYSRSGVWSECRDPTTN